MYLRRGRGIVHVSQVANRRLRRLPLSRTMYAPTRERAMPKPVKVGVVGVGAISNQYLGMAKNVPIVQMAASAHLGEERAKAQADKYNIPKVCTVDELMKDDSIEIILNLPTPRAHVPIGLQEIKAAKHMSAEKPLGPDRE